MSEPSVDTVRRLMDAAGLPVVDQVELETIAHGYAHLSAGLDVLRHAQDIGDAAPAVAFNAGNA